MFQKSARLPIPYSGPASGTYANQPASGAGVGKEAAEQQQAADEVEPVGAGGHARERGVARADHQRHEVEREALHHRHGEQEHHRRAVHREQLVVEVRAERACCSAVASWWRISPPITPAAPKKHSAVTMKRSPMVLWPLALQEADDAGLVGPGALELRGGRRSRSRAVAQMPAAACCRLRPALARPREPGFAANGSARGRHCSDPRYAEIATRSAGAAASGGMSTPGLIRLRIRDPLRARGGGVLQRAGGERRAASDVGEIGRAPSPGRCAGDRVAHRAARLLDEVASPLLLRSRGLAGRLALNGEPALVIGRRVGDDDQRHVRVLVAAEFRALAPVDARADRRETRSWTRGPGSGPSCRRGSAPRSCG